MEENLVKLKPHVENLPRLGLHLVNDIYAGGPGEKTSDI
jgi:hypothetical protein